MNHHDAPSPHALALIDRYRALYPRASEQQALTAVHGWNNPEHALSVLEEALIRLRNELNAWDAPGPMARERIIDAWRRISTRELSDGQTLVTLDFDDQMLTSQSLANFPALTVSLAHVQELSLISNPLADIPDAFIRHFPDLRRFIAQDCELSTIPANLNPNLFLLDLSDNRIVWNDTAQATLQTYSQLTALVLSNNSLQVAPDLTALPLLGGVDLSNNDLTSLPRGLPLLSRAEVIDLSSNQLTTLPVGFMVPPAVGQALNLEDNPFTPATLTRIDHYYTTHGIDLMVAQQEYRHLLDPASDSQRQCWLQLCSTMPLTFIRAQRYIIETIDYRIAPQTTLRRFWHLLEWLNQDPALRERAIERAHQSVLLLEPAAEIARALAAPTARLQTEQLLEVAVNRVRCSVITDALFALIPALNDDVFEPLYQWTLRAVATEQVIPLPQAPRDEELVFLDAAVNELPLLSSQWMEALHTRLENLNPGTGSGLDALLARDESDRYEQAFWVERLEQRYSERFAQSRALLDQELESAQRNLPEGELIVRAEQLRDLFEQQTDELLRTLSRNIWAGTIEYW